MTTMVEVTEVVVVVVVAAAAIVVAHHRLIIVDDAMNGHGLVHTLLVDIRLLAPDWGLRFHLMWTNFRCIIVLCPPKRWLTDKQ